MYNAHNTENVQYNSLSSLVLHACVKQKAHTLDFRYLAYKYALTIILR